MKIKSALIISLFLFACGRIENSSSQDAAAYQSPAAGGSPQHTAALAIISAKCATCHQHASWPAFTDAVFVSSGLIVPQNPVGSKIYYRNQLGPGPDNNMPSGGGPAATTDELQTISDWINSIN